MGWRIKVILLGFLILLAGAFSVSAQTGQSDCPGALPRRLIVGEDGHRLPDWRNNLRAEPTASAELLGEIPPGGEFQVIGGPVCAEGYEWWWVNYEGTQGWTVESDSDTYWLEPALATETVTLATTAGAPAYQGVTLQVDPALAHMVTARYFPPADANPGDRWSDNYLERVEFTLRGYPDRLTLLTAAAPVIRVYPVADFVNSQPAGLAGQSAQDTMAGLQALLAERPSLSAAVELPFLPHDAVYQGVIAQAAYLSGEHVEGIRYLTIFTQQAVVVNNQNLVYVFQGLTRDGAYYVSIRLPLDAAGLDDTVPEISDYETFVTSTYPAYLAGVTEWLNGEVAFAPSLATLDALATSINVTPPVTVAYEGITLTADPGLASNLTAESVPADQYTVPHILLRLQGYADTLHREFDAPSISIYRVTDLIESEGMLGDDARVLLADLPGVLGERPDPLAFDVFNNPLPDLSPNVAQGVLAHMRYLDFQGGQGYRFLTYYTQQWAPPSETSLLYRYIGLSDDGEVLISATFPVNTGFLPDETTLPDIQNDPTASAEAIFQAIQQYVAEATDTLNAWPEQDFTPSLDQLDTLIAGLRWTPPN